MTLKICSNKQITAFTKGQAPWRVALGTWLLFYLSQNVLLLVGLNGKWCFVFMLEIKLTVLLTRIQLRILSQDW